jgi:hypothetical protein
MRYCNADRAICKQSIQEFLDKLQDTLGHVNIQSSKDKKTWYKPTLSYKLKAEDIGLRYAKWIVYVKTDIDPEAVAKIRIVHGGGTDTQLISNKGFAVHSLNYLMGQMNREYAVLGLGHWYD